LVLRPVIVIREVHRQAVVQEVQLSTYFIGGSDLRFQVGVTDTVTLGKAGNAVEGEGSVTEPASNICFIEIGSQQVRISIVTYLCPAGTQLTIVQYVADGGTL